MVGGLMASVDWQALGTTVLAWGAVACGLGLVIFVHELGHFLVAKWCGVKCEKFYIGFDFPIKIGPLSLPPRLARVQWGETEYGIGILPLGGYVKMLGQDDDPRNAERELERIRVRKATDGSDAGRAEAEDGAAAASAAAVSAAPGDSMTAGWEDAAPVSSPADEPFELDPRSFPAKSIPQRMAIISAGVVMNLIFAVLFAMFAFADGVPYTPCEIGGTVAGGPAWEAGIVPGSKIIQIGEQGERSEQLRFDWDLKHGIGVAQGNEETLGVRLPNGQETSVRITPRMLTAGWDKVPTIGILAKHTNTLAVEKPVLPGSAADGAGLKPHDQILAINGEPVRDSVEIERFLAARADQPLTVTVASAATGSAAPSGGVLTREVVIPPKRLRGVGLFVQYDAIAAIRHDSPAARAGLQKGDRIVSVAGQPLADPLALPTMLWPYHGRSVEIGVVRPGSTDPVPVAVTPELPQAVDYRFLPGFPVGCESLGAAYPIRNTVLGVAPDGPAAKAGLRPGDQLVSVQFLSSDPQQPPDERINGGQAIVLDEGLNNWTAIFQRLQAVKPDVYLRVVYTHLGNESAAELYPIDSDGYFPERGLHLTPVVAVRKAASVSEAIALGFQRTGEDIYRVGVFLNKLVTGGISPTSAGGPISIFRVAKSEASQGLPRLLIFLTFLSANLAVLNFLPIPALDGGHMMFLIAEGVRGKPVDERWQIGLTLAGVACLLSLMVFVSVLDLHRVFG